MPAYFIVNSEITDPEGFERYRSVVRATFEGHEPEFLVSTNDSETLEGTPAGPRTVVIRFPDRERALAWYHSDAYQEIVGLRIDATAGFAILAEGR